MLEHNFAQGGTSSYQRGSQMITLRHSETAFLEQPQSKNSGLWSGISCSPNNQGQQNSISSAGLHIDVAYVRELVGRIVNMMVSCSKRASEHHLSHHIARGLRKMLTGLEEWEKRNLGNSQSLTQNSHDTLPMFKPVVIPGAQPLGERDTILNPPPPFSLPPTSRIPYKSFRKATGS